MSHASIKLGKKEMIFLGSVSFNLDVSSSFLLVLHCYFLFNKPDNSHDDCNDDYSH